MAYRLGSGFKRYGVLLLPVIGLAYLQTDQKARYNANGGSAPTGSHGKAPPSPRIAIVGSGIGGTSSAHFVRELFGSLAVIDVYEKSNVVGGRAAVANVNEKLYEAGACVIHESNRYVIDFTKLAGLAKIRGNDIGNMILGLYDETDPIFVDSRWKIISLIKLLWRYGFSLITMNRFLDAVLRDFCNIYELQDNQESFKTVEEMLVGIGGRTFFDYTQTSARQLLAERGINRRIIDELATAVTLTNYGQNMDVNGLVGTISLAGAQEDKLWVVKGGKYQICERILKRTGANVFYNRTVHTIRKLGAEDGRTSYELVGNNAESFGVYDAVIVAAPLEVPATSLLCEGCTKWPTKGSGEYQQTVTTFVVGMLNYNAFGIKKFDDAPEYFLSVNKNNSFHTICEVFSVECEAYDRRKIKEPLVYKIFSKDFLSDTQLREFFTEIRTVKVVPWMAYPKYSPPEQFTPFVLDDGVFYVNAIERAASALEMSAIGGRNAALLCKKYLDKIYGEQASGNLHTSTEHGRTEL